MKKAITCLVLMLLFALPAGAAPATDSLTEADVRAMQDTGLSTLGEYAQALGARYYTWSYLGAATGETTFTLDVPGGAVSLTVLDAPAYQDDIAGLVGSDTLDEAALALPATLTGCVWENRALALPVAPGGMLIGDSGDALLATFPNAETTDVSDYGIGYDQRVSVLYATPDEWKEYDQIDYYLKDGSVALISYTHWTDPE